MLGEEIRDLGLPVCASSVRGPYCKIPASLVLKHPGSISLDTLRLTRHIAAGWRRGSFMHPMACRDCPPFRR
jgi:hypothetical protein